MSEDFLARWSRRKRAAVEKGEAAETAAPVAPPDRDDEAESTATTPAAGSAKADEPLFDLKDLPPIETITAATDIRPFLRPGVPADLARAALRRAWTADPAIRDFVGLAEYAWDYNTPGSMAGFGPLEMTDELRAAVARILGDVPGEEAPESRPPAAALEAGNGEPLAPASLTSVGSGAITQDHLANKQDVAGLPEPAAEVRHEDAEVRPKDTAMQHRPAEDEIAPSTIRRGHGRALPK